MPDCPLDYVSSYMCNLPLIGVSVIINSTSRALILVRVAPLYRYHRNTLVPRRSQRRKSGNVREHGRNGDCFFYTAYQALVDVLIREA